MDRAIHDSLDHSQTIDITTTGRRTGQPRRIEIALHNIEGVRVHQSITGRIFNYGTVRIEGTGVDAVTTPAIADPVGFVEGDDAGRKRNPAGSGGRCGGGSFGGSFGGHAAAAGGVAERKA